MIMNPELFFFNYIHLLAEPCSIARTFSCKGKRTIAGCVAHYVEASLRQNSLRYSLYHQLSTSESSDIIHSTMSGKQTDNI